VTTAIHVCCGARGPVGEEFPHKADCPTVTGACLSCGVLPPKHAKGCPYESPHFRRMARKGAREAKRGAA
jgi:hypothetical protein